MSPTQGRSTRRWVMLVTIAALAFVGSCHKSQNGIHADAQVVTSGPGSSSLAIEWNGNAKG